MKQLPGRLSLLILLTAACSTGTAVEKRQAVFQHRFEASPVPWTGQDFDNRDDRFTFAVFSDLTGGERQDVFALAIEQLRLLRPEFIIGVGDLMDEGGVNIANLRMSGILDKSGRLPLNGEDLCLQDCAAHSSTK